MYQKSQVRMAWIHSIRLGAENLNRVKSWLVICFVFHLKDMCFSSFWTTIDDIIISFCSSNEVFKCNPSNQLTLLDRFHWPTEYSIVHLIYRFLCPQQLKYSFYSVNERACLKTPCRAILRLLSYVFFFSQINNLKF